MKNDIILEIDEEFQRLDIIAQQLANTWSHQSEKQLS